MPDELKVHATERYGYGFVDPRVVYGEIAPWKHPPHAPVLRTVIGVTVMGKFYPRHPPIEQDWEHVTELLTIEEEKA